MAWTPPSDAVAVNSNGWSPPPDAVAVEASSNTSMQAIKDAIGGIESMGRMAWNAPAGFLAKGFGSLTGLGMGEDLASSLLRGDEAANRVSILPFTKSGAIADEMLGKGYELARETAGDIGASDLTGLDPKSEAKARSLYEAGFDAIAFGGLLKGGIGKLREKPVGTPESPYVQSKQLQGVEHLTDAEYIDWLKAKRDTETVFEPGQRDFTNEQAGNPYLDQSRLRVDENGQPFDPGLSKDVAREEGRYNQPQRDLFDQNQPVPDTGLEPKRGITGGNIQPEGLTEGVEGGFEATRLESNDKPPLRIQDASERANTIPYSNTIHEYLYSRFPELTEKLQKDPITQRLMKAVQETTDHMNELRNNAGTELVGGVRVKLEDIRNSKKAQAEMDRLKGQYERSAQMLDQQVQTLSNRLKSTGKALGIDIADNAKFADWINEKLNSSGPESPGKDIIGKPYQEGGASANIEKVFTLPKKSQGEPLPAKRVNWSDKPSPELVNYINDGDMGGALNHIATASQNTFYRQLARLLNRMQDLPSLRFGDAPKMIMDKNGNWVYNKYDYVPESLRSADAVYEPKMHEIYIINQRGLEQILLHEGLHSALNGALSKYRGMPLNTIRAMKSKSEQLTAVAVRAINQLFNIMSNRYDLEQFKGAHKASAHLHAFSNVDEFISYGLTDKPFMNWLKKQDISKEPALGTLIGRAKNGWKSFLNAVRDILGLPKGSISALEAMLRNVSSIIENQPYGTNSKFSDMGPLASKVGFEEFKASLPKPYQDMAESLWKDVKAKEQGPSFIENKKQGVVGDFIHDISDARSWYVPIVTPFKEARRFLLQGHDIGLKSLHQLAGQQIFAGGKLYSKNTKNPVVKYFVDTAYGALEGARVAVDHKLHGIDGIVTTWEKLSKAEQIAVTKVRDQFRMKEDLTHTRLTELGMNEKQIAFYDAGQKHFKDSLNDINAEKVAHHQKPITPMPGYWPSSWGGDYYFEVFKKHSDGSKQLVKIEDRDWKGFGGKGLKGIRERFAAENPNFEIGEIKQRPRRGESKDALSLFDQMKDLVDKDSPDGQALARIFDAYTEEIADSTRGFRKHFEINRGVGGFKGNKLETSDWQNAKDSIRSAEGWFRDAHTYLETKKAARNINGVLFDKEISALHPNAIAYGRKYWQKYLGTETIMERAFNALPELIGESMGLSRYAHKDAIRGLRHGMSIFFLGLNRPVFVLAQRLQSLQFTPPALVKMQVDLDLGTWGKEVADASARGFFDRTMSLVDPSKMSDLGKEALQYAKDNRIVDVMWMDDVLHAGQTNVAFAKRLVLGEVALKWGDRASRLDAYMQFTHMLSKSGLKGKELFEAAADSMRQAMVDYSELERPMIYKNLGIVGDLASPLQTFAHNYFTQLYQYGKEALSHPLDSQYAKPLLAFLVTSYYMAGIMGLPFRGDLDWIIDMARENGLLPPKTRNVTQFMLENSAAIQGKGKDITRYGIFSGLTGMNVSPTFQAGTLLPDHGIGGRFPYVAKPAEIVGTGSVVAGKQIGRLFGGQGPTDVDTAKFATAVTPPAGKFMREAALQDKQTGMFPNPKDMTGTVKRGPPSITDPNWVASAFGSNSIKESEERTVAYQMTLQKQAIDKRLQSLEQSIVAMRRSGQDYSKLAKEYTDLGGNFNNISNAIIKNKMDQNRTSLEQAKGIPKNVRQANQYRSAENYGVSK